MDCSVLCLEYLIDSRNRNKGHRKGNKSRYTVQPIPSAPSVPSKSQSYVYDETHDGRLVAQNLALGYSGLKDDFVGPGDYDPKINSKFPSAPATKFPKVRLITLICKYIYLKQLLFLE